MKKILLIFLCAYYLSPIVYCQDVQRFAEHDLMGTARYVGMGGAMTAIGGDPSAAMDNPAGLALYRHCEIATTIDLTIDRTRQTEDSYQRNRFSVPNVTGIVAWGNPNKQRGMIYNNFMFSYNRLTNFNREIVAQATDLGMVSTICNITNDRGGLSEDRLQNQPWYDDQVAWLSILGYETYLINPTENNQWIPATDFTEGSLSISELGNYDQYTFAWASNISNQWYIGLGLNIPTINYTKHVSIIETDRIQSAELKSMYHISGVGVNGSVGLIYRPFQSLRIGASFQTPTVIKLSEQTESDMYTTLNGQKYEQLTPASGVISTELVAPLRTSFSIAGQIYNRGMIALQYDYAHAPKDQKLGISPMKDIHTLRIGLELQAYRGLFINAGYVYESSFLKEEPIWLLAYNDIRTDMDYRYTDNTQYASIGLGYRSQSVVAQIAYQYRWQHLHQYASEMHMTPMEIFTTTHRFVATLAWRF